MPMTLETGETGKRIFAKPLAVLIDERTASTAELISNALQETGRAKIFGTNSCGCVLAFLDYKPLAGGGDMTLSEFGFITPQNRRLEGTGITPDRIVPLTIKDLQTDRDASLEEAEKYLSEM
jgi:carboxyl-terminal processing protease